MKHRLPFKTYIYFLSQSINLTAAVMSVTMAALVGASLAPEPWLSTVPYGFQFLFVMLVTYPASRLMAIIGRKKSFLLATIPLAGSGVLGYLAVEQHLFPWLIVAHALLGVYIAFANFNRFAATDDLSPYLKPRAISLVVAGGVIAAIIGPILTSFLKDLAGLHTFAACYGAFIGLAIISLVLNLLVKEVASPCYAAHNDSENRQMPMRRVLKNKTLVLAVAVSAMGYGIMNLLMIQSSMYMSAIHVQFSIVSTAIRWHVVAMFAPSFFTGLIIQQLGLRAVVLSGILLLILNGIINLVSHDYHVLIVSLIALGLGWNFTYVGGSALLTQGLEGMPEFAVKMQGLNDLGVSIMATIGAFAPAFLLAWLGWSGTNALSIGICLALLMISMVILGHKYQSGAKQEVVE